MTAADSLRPATLLKRGLYILFAICIPSTGCKPQKPDAKKEQVIRPKDGTQTHEPLSPIEGGENSDPEDTYSKESLTGESLSLSCCTFPYADRKVTGNYTASPGKFGASRGGRTHAATDLYKTVGEPIVAIADGEVLDSYYFYCGTDAVEVDHGQFLARYGEISKLADGISKGAQVKKGQVIAYVGRLTCYHQPMLHLELYKGTESGNLSGSRNRFLRRPDLFDPTPCVQEWEKGDSSNACWENQKTISEGL